jgi:hypothetical protein
MAACCKSFRFWVLCLLQSVFFELKLRRSEALKFCKHHANNGPFSPSLQNTNFHTTQLPPDPQSQPPYATNPPSFNSLHFDAERHWIIRGGSQPGVGHTCTSGQPLFQKSRPSETQHWQYASDDDGNAKHASWSNNVLAPESICKPWTTSCPYLRYSFKLCGPHLAWVCHTAS